MEDVECCRVSWWHGNPDVIIDVAGWMMWIEWWCMELWRRNDIPLSVVSVAWMEMAIAICNGGLDHWILILWWLVVDDVEDCNVVPEGGIVDWEW